MPSIPPFPAFPSAQEIEDIISDATAYIPHIPHDVAIIVRGVYNDLMRFGPPEFPVPEVGKLFVVQVPIEVMPPPPPPKTLSERSLDWIKEHRLAVSIAGVAVIGALGYTAYNLNATHGRLAGLRRRAAQKKGKGHATSSSGAAAPSERDIVIILGADSVPYGPSVVRDFQKNGYIVLASVFSGEAADDLERDTEGYVRALVLDAEEAGSIPHFLRSLSSTLSLRFPTTIHGDPYQSMTSSQSTSLARVTSVISFLSLGQAELLPFNNFSSPITFSESYTHQFMTRALSPLAILNATLPLFRHRKTIGSPRESSSSTQRRYGASVILCVPAAARVGVLGSSSHSMANHAVAQGFRILRREAALDPLLEGTDLRFVTIDVGEFADPAEIKRIGAQRKEKGVSGRIPTDVRVLSKTLMSIVDASRRPWSLDWMKMVVLGTRRSVGAGAATYALASHLPTFMLDFLLLLPHRLAMLRESLQQTPGLAVPPQNQPPPPPSATTATPTAPNGDPVSASASQTGAESEAESSAYTPSASTSASVSASASEASSTDSQGPTRANTIADSWVSVQDDE